MKDIFDLIKNKIKLHEYALKTMKLKLIGNRYVGLCPFHHEKTPSFYINIDQNLFYCFGCHKGGDLFNFYCNLNNCDKKEALKELACIANIQYASEIKKNDLNCLLEYFKTQKKHIEWLLNRGLNNEFISKFQLGFSGSFYEMKKYINQNNLNLNNLGFKESLLKSIQNRVIFPIFNEIGSLVSFSARSLEMQVNYKYINGSESAIFHKNEVLYGLNYIKNKNEIYLVEGYIDVIMMFQYGFSSVAAMGTAINNEHIKKLWLYTNKVIIMLDGDEAGVKASERIALLILPDLIVGKELLFIQLPSNHDPASYLTKYNSLANLKKYYLYEYLLLNKTIPNSPNDRAIFFNQLNEYALTIKDKNLRFEYNKYWNSFKYAKKNKDQGKFQQLTSEYLILLLLKYVMVFPDIGEQITQDFLKLNISAFYKENLIKFLNKELCDELLLDKLNKVYVDQEMSIKNVLSNWYDIYDKLQRKNEKMLFDLTQESWLRYKELKENEEND